MMLLSVHFDAFSRKYSDKMFVHIDFILLLPSWVLSLMNFGPDPEATMTLPPASVTNELVY